MSLILFDIFKEGSDATARNKTLKVGVIE